MAMVDWDERARHGVGYQSVIDPGDTSGLKNGLIDRIQWGQIEGWARRRRSLLDFGCGTGRFAQRIAQLGVAYRGVDASIEMIEAARRLHRHTAAAFEQVAHLPLPFAAASFDGCLTVGVLQCLKTADGAELARTVAELARVMSAGGELLVIEQASASGGFSGSVSETATQQDYLNALAAHFTIERVGPVRFGTLSRLSSWFIRFGRRLPFRGGIEGLLARHETAIAQSASADELKRLSYFDLAIVAVRRAGA